MRYDPTFIWRRVQAWINLSEDGKAVPRCAVYTFASLALGLLVACTAEPRVSPLIRPAPSLGDDVVDCLALWGTHATPPAGVPLHAKGELEGWAALSYVLKGDGKAHDLKVIDSEPKGVFVDGAAIGILKASFKTGEVHDNCISVTITYRRPM